MSTPRGTKRRTHSGAFSAGVLGALVVLGISGCTTDAESPSSATEVAVTSPAVPSAATPSETADAFAVGSPCLLLSTDQVTTLLGEPREGRETVVYGTTIHACEFGNTAVLGVQVAQVPAGEWANAMPDIYEALVSLPEGAVDPSILEQLAEAADILKTGGSIEPDKACEYFSYMVEASGAPAGTALTQRYIPDLESAIALSVQQCTGGVYSSILVGRADIADHPELFDTTAGFIADLG